MKYEKIIEENKRRLELYFKSYDPIFGDLNEQVIPRTLVSIFGTSMLLPTEMVEEYPNLISGDFDSVELSEEKKLLFLKNLIDIRMKYDFEFWCYTCVKIQDKLSKADIPFLLNYGQRKTAHIYETQRMAKQPIRAIIVKARQWGGSTVTQIYMLWLQLYWFKNWHSAVISQLKEQANNIRNMIENVVNKYPKEITDISISSFHGSQYIKYIPQRGCKIQVASAETPDALRSFDFSMLHMSEVGLWKSDGKKSADDLAQAVFATVPSNVAGTFICIESTAKGIGNFFHRQYMNAKSGSSDLKPIFVAWFEAEIYADFKYDESGQGIMRDENGIPVSNIKDYHAFIKTLTQYEKAQWNQGATLEGIKWYREFKKNKDWNDFKMKSEYPGTDNEAFQTKSNKFFEQVRIDYARSSCIEPIIKCDIRGASDFGVDAMLDVHLDFDGYKESSGMQIWIFPDKKESTIKTKIKNRFLVVCDIGGMSHRADWSVISVFDRATMIDTNGALERAATWRGHIDHDMLAWKAVQIAMYYDNALLVIESNTLETRDRSEDSTYEGNHFYTVLDTIADYYSNLYVRNATPDKVADKPTMKYGFHTNVRTKRLAYDMLTQNLRDGEYVEHDRMVVDEMDWLENKPDGSIGAIKGQHDDLIDTTAIGNYISSKEMSMPVEVQIVERANNRGRSGGGFASF